MTWNAAPRTAVALVSLAAACAPINLEVDPPMEEPVLMARLRRLCARAPITVAHRGDSGAFPENTLPAFAAALDAGASMIELDYHVTADGVLVCIHDATLDRTTDAATILGRKRVEVRSTQAADLARLDAGAWKARAHAGARVPTLEQALTLIQPGAVTMIEHKAGDAASLVTLLRRLGLVDDVIVQSFDWDFVTEVHRLEPRLALGALGEGPLSAERLAALPATGARIVHWDVRALRAEDVALLHAHGYLVCVYTANDDVSLVGAATLGIDAITTNHPARLLALIADGVAVRVTRR